LHGLGYRKKARDKGLGLPITSKLLPFRWRNVVYLAELAALTRLATGAARVMENRPSCQHDDRLSRDEKRQALVERFFVEILGTVGYMAFLHLGQDMVGGLFSKFGKTQIPSVKALSEEKKAAVAQALHKLGLTLDQFDRELQLHYNPDLLKNPRSGLLYRTLYEHEVVRKDVHGQPVKVFEKSTLADLQKKIVKHYNLSAHLDEPTITRQFKEVLRHFDTLESFALKMNKVGALCIGTGVLISAVIGGALTQLTNDGIIAPAAQAYFKKKSLQAQNVLEKSSQQIKQDSWKTMQTVHSGPVDLANTLPRVAQPVVQSLQPLKSPAGLNVISAPESVLTPPLPIAHIASSQNPKIQSPTMAFGVMRPKPYTTSFAGPKFGGGL
jgi:uncharacterized membrane-anchored protein YhcB (DUF1043 family)